MVNKSRPSVSSFLSTSSKALHTQQELAEAQERIAKLEEELVAERQRIQSQIDGSRISQATVSPTTGCGFFSLGEFVWKPLDRWHSIDSS